MHETTRSLKEVPEQYKAWECDERDKKRRGKEKKKSHNLCCGWQRHGFIAAATKDVNGAGKMQATLFDVIEAFFHSTPWEDGGCAQGVAGQLFDSLILACVAWTRRL